MFHLAAYQATIDNTANTQLAGLVDPVLSRSVSSSAYIFQDKYKCVAGVYIGTTAERAMLVSPTLRQVNPPFFRPIIAAAKPASLSELAWYADQPFTIPALEEVAPQVTSGTAGTELATFLLWVTQGLVPIPAGQIYTARATATITAVPNAWTLGSFTLDQSLPSGNYAVVGAECIGTTILGFRLVFPNQLFRPGAIGHAAVGDINDWRLQTRRLGVWGQFLNTAPPQLEILCTAADTAQELYLQLIPMSGQLGSMI
jgi:hypothetical protein